MIVRPRSRLPRAASPWDRIALIVASGGYTGLAPVAPGTVGSAVAVAIWWVAGTRSPAVWIPVIVMFAALSVWASGRGAAAGDRKDPSWVVADEIVGQWVALAVAPPSTLQSAAVSFLLFRGFDIVKPFPARSLERLPGGYGIVADDVAAGLYAGLSGLVLARLVWAAW